jgi:tetratricopeptide (TPR) repeat protein
LPYFYAALAAWKKVVDDNPDRFSEPIELGGTHNRIGWLFFGRGRITEALEQYEAARAVFQKLMDHFPAQLLPRTRSELSNILINITEIQRMQGRLAEARANCDRAIAIRESVVKDFPEVLSYRIRMGECWLRSGQVRVADGYGPGAVADWRRAIALYEALPPRVGEIAMFEAGSHALLAGVASLGGSGLSADEAGSEAEKAMAILRRIVAEGYHAPELRNESCLEPLRGRTDFRLLMMDLAFPAEPFGRAE